MSNETRRMNAMGKAELTTNEILAVRKIVAERGTVTEAGRHLGISGATVLRILSGIPVHNLTASHLRSRLECGGGQGRI